MTAAEPLGPGAAVLATVAAGFAGAGVTVACVGAAGAGAVGAAAAGAEAAVGAAAALTIFAENRLAVRNLFATRIEVEVINRCYRSRGRSLRCAPSERWFLSGLKIHEGEFELVVVKALTSAYSDRLASVHAMPGPGEASSLGRQSSHSE